jgi:hypothetical protein
MPPGVAPGAHENAEVNVTPSRENGDMVDADAVWFSAAARAMADEARRGGLPVVPGFRSPPRRPGVRRAIRRLPGLEAIVSVELHERSREDVLADLVEGVVVANRLIGPDAERWRARLRRAVGPAGPSAAAA